MDFVHSLIKCYICKSLYMQSLEWKIILKVRWHSQTARIYIKRLYKYKKEWNSFVFLSTLSSIFSSLLYISHFFSSSFSPTFSLSLQWIFFNIYYRCSKLDYLSYILSFPAPELVYSQIYSCSTSLLFH